MSNKFIQKVRISHLHSQMYFMPKPYYKIKNLLIFTYPKKMIFLEFIPKEKELNAQLKKELKRVLLQLNILGKFMSPGDGIKEKIL